MESYNLETRTSQILRSSRGTMAFYTFSISKYLMFLLSLLFPLLHGERGILSALSSSCQKQHFRLFFLPQNLRKALLMPPETDRQDVCGSTKKHKPAFNPSQYIQTNIVSSLPKIKIHYNLLYSKLIFGKSLPEKLKKGLGTYIAGRA